MERFGTKWNVFEAGYPNHTLAAEAARPVGLNPNYLD